MAFEDQRNACFGCLRNQCPMITNQLAIGWVRLSTGWLIFDERYDIIVFCYPNQFLSTVKKQQSDDNRRVSKARAFKLYSLATFKIRPHKLLLDRCSGTLSDIVRRLTVKVQKEIQPNLSAKSKLYPRQKVSITADMVEMNNQNHQIKNVRIWEHGAESVGFNYQTVTSHYKVNVYSGTELIQTKKGPVRDMLRQLHLVVVCDAPKCSIDVAPELKFPCKYFGQQACLAAFSRKDFHNDESERVNFSRGKQIADLALSKLKTEQSANAFVLIKENEFLICSETQDFAMIPYDKVTYQVQDDSDCSFAAIIAVLPDTPPNCIVLQVADSSLEVLQLLSHKSGVIVGDAPKVEDKKPEKNKKMFHAKIQKTFSRRATTPDIGLGKDSLNLFQRTKSLIARNKADNA